MGRKEGNLRTPSTGKLVVLFFAVALMFMAADGPLGILADIGHLCHSEDSGCPDRDSDGVPCGPDCPCSCCPGHRTVPAICGLPFFLDTPSFSGAVHLTAQAPCQKEVPFTIFHPPRA